MAKTDAEGWAGSMVEALLDFITAAFWPPQSSFHVTATRASFLVASGMVPQTDVFDTVHRPIWHPIIANNQYILRQHVQLRMW